MKDKEIKAAVKGRYAQIAKQDQESCCPSCARGASSMLQAKATEHLREDLEHVPKEAIMAAITPKRASRKITVAV